MTKNSPERTPPAQTPRQRDAQAAGWHAALLPRGSYCASYTPVAEVVGFSFEAQAGTHAFASDRRTPFRARPNGLAYVPAGCDVYSRSATGGEYLKLTRVEGTTRTPLGERRFSDFIDRAAIDAAHRVRAMLLAGDRPDPLMFEHDLGVLEGSARNVLEARAAMPAAARWMTPRRMKLVDELIEDRLDDGLTVHDLASALDLSAGFFTRAFRAATGKSPHDYIVDCRLVRARHLLESTTDGLSAIALASGFASHAHMTSTFRARLGTTPNALRGLGQREIE